MKRIITILAVIALSFFLSLLPTWNFSKHIAIPTAHNPLWTGENQEIDSPLTEALRQQGYRFQTGKGAEADPDEICFGHFGSDEYWVIQYHRDRQIIDATSWIIGLHWIGHLHATLRFSRLERTLMEQVNGATAPSP